jgi:hypothetical protein
LVNRGSLACRLREEVGTLAGALPKFIVGRREMYALTCFVEGMLAVHVTLLVSYFVGAAAYPWCERESEFRPPARMMVRLLLTCGLGLSIIGLGLFTLGMLGLLYAPCIIVMVVALWAAGTLAWRSAPLSASYWRSRLHVLRASWDGPLLALYLLMLVTGARAVLPNTGVSDAVEEHLAWAQDWVLAHRIVLDPFIVFPFYACNFVLFFSAFILLKAALLVNFLSWMMGLLSVLAIYAMICDDDARVAPRWQSAIGFFSALAFLLAPIFQAWGVTGFVDASFGALALLALLGVQTAIRDRNWAWALVAAVTAGYLIGAKGSFVLLLPAFFVALLWACSSIGAGKRRTAIVLAVLCAVASPWYVRNLVMAGDPIPPVLNIALYGTDGLLTPAEWNAMEADMATSKSFGDLVKFPWRSYTNPTFHDFGELGATALFLLLYVPTLVALLALFLGRRLPERTAIPIAVLSYFVLYYIVTSTLGRYALLFYPLLAACVGMLLVEAVARWPKLAPIAVVIAACTAIPTPQPAMHWFWVDQVENDYKNLIYHYPSETAYLDANEDGYPEEQFVASLVHRRGGTGRVYVIQANGGGALNYYFRRQGIMSIGDWDGPAGYFRLLQAVDRGESAEFLEGLDVDAILFTPHPLLDAGVDHLLETQLEAAGYRRVPVGSQTYTLFARGDIAKN